ncbi:alpha/beta hydrolase family protein [Actinomadura opuntiae]|uniref:alpha/beta hydrolase family protein n=1 Tax=Actinomadura sp. OS1-43 TaxID=604315 RepID=UPI00255A9AB5|nr:alpha/beta hydrolase [Actinomadura sp. OS1-43]MDL4821113.1 alpha/beta hydrolase [Actinomadura sp. OS1-43]
MKMWMKPRTRHAGRAVRSRALAAATLAAAGLLSTTVATTPATAAAGPDPTLNDVKTLTGPYQTSTATVQNSGQFGAATIYYPTSTTDGPYPGVVLAPGLTSSQSVLSWYGKTLASQGFVAMTINFTSTMLYPTQRQPQIDKALTYLTQTSTVKSRVNANTLGVLGHSFGGGGSLLEEFNKPSLKAAILLDPVNQPAVQSSQLSQVAIPTMIITGQNDTLSSESPTVYNGLPSSTPKQLLDIAGGNHGTVLTANANIARYVVPWLKVYLSGDSRYQQFNCPITSDSYLSSHQGNCSS